MSEVTSHLPARPSLEQLRKQAKELLQQLHSGDPYVDYRSQLGDVGSNEFSRGAIVRGMQVH